MHHPKMPSEEARGAVVPRPFGRRHNIRRAAQPPSAGDPPRQRGRGGGDVCPLDDGSAADVGGRPGFPAGTVASDASPLRRYERRRRYVSSTEYEYATSAVPPVR